MVVCRVHAGAGFPEGRRGRAGVGGVEGFEAGERNASSLRWSKAERRLPYECGVVGISLTGCRRAGSGQSEIVQPVLLSRPSPHRHASRTREICANLQNLLQLFAAVTAVAVMATARSEKNLQQPPTSCYRGALFLSCARGCGLAVYTCSKDWPRQNSCLAAPLRENGDRGHSASPGYSP